MVSGSKKKLLACEMREKRNKMLRKHSLPGWTGWVSTKASR